MAKIKLPDGQELEIPDDIAKDDESLKNALAPYVPDIRNAKLNRSTKDGVMTVNVVKQAGTKGAEPECARIILCRECWREDRSAHLFVRSVDNVIEEADRLDCPVHGDSAIRVVTGLFARGEFTVE